MSYLIKLMVFLLSFSCLILVRDIFSFVRAYMNNTQVNFSKKRLLLTAISISYIVTIIFTGLKF